MPIAFMGIQIGEPNGNEKTLIDSSRQIMQVDLPEGFRRYIGKSNRSMFDNPAEKTISTFFASIIDNQDEKHNGWGIVKSDGDSITTIHFIIPNCELDTVFDRMKTLFVERYGESDSTYVEGEDEELQNILCYWNFINNKRITLNKCEYNSSTISHEWEQLFKTYERVEIVYQDMNAVYRHEAAERVKAEEEKQQNRKVEEDRKAQNRKARENQQL